MPHQFGKQTALPFNNNISHSLSSFDLIHSDVWGSSPISTPGGSRYFVIFVDDFLYILGFISSKIVLNFVKYIVTLPE